MANENKHLDDLKDIKNIMQQSSRYSNLSGWSGVSAGVCALAGAWFISTKIECLKRADCNFAGLGGGGADLDSALLKISLVTFAAASILAFIFLYDRSRKSESSTWNFAARRLLLSVAVPMVVGGLFVYKMLSLGYYELLAPACLIFYGLALLNASKYTLGEVRYLGYGELVLGIIACWATAYGLYFWAAGFGVLHIIYGLVMWYKYERK